MSDARGEYAVTLRLVRLEDLQVIGERRLPIQSDDRMLVTDLVFRFGNLIFARPGRYEFQLFANGRSVGVKSFSVVEET